MSKPLNLDAALVRRAPQLPAIPDNPVRSRANAAFFGLMDRYMHWKLGALKARLFAQLPSVVVELGAGTGANFRYLRPGTKVIAIEPNRHMHPRLRRNAARWNIELEIRQLGAEGIDLDDASVDAVISSLVLCTVEDQAQALREVLRVLRPGGKLVCIEHVAAPAHSFIGRIQRWVFRPWRWAFEGCHTHRDTALGLRAAGFGAVAIESFDLRSVFLPVRPQIAAVCVK